MRIRSYFRRPRNNMNFTSNRRMMKSRVSSVNSKSTGKRKSKLYFKNTRTTLNEIKTEMCEMYDIIQKQQRVIEKIESGAYSAGIKSFNIPSKDKPP
jgi:hypothetical protein